MGRTEPLAWGADFVTRKPQRLCAYSQPGATFDRLYQLLETPQWIRTALRRVLSNRGSRTPGVDGMTARHLQTEAAQEALVQDIVETMRARRYHPQPVRRLYIPQASDPTKLRPLGVPTLKDRCVQEAVRMILEPIYEPHFAPHSYGFRPFRSAHHALARIHQLATAPKGAYTWVIEGDIRDCFGSIDHQVLLTLLRRTIRDRALLTVIRRQLKAGALENLRYHETEAGTPQGGVVSPLLANIYLHELDRYIATQYEAAASRSYRARLAKRGTLVPCSIVRYADDFVVWVRGTEAQAQALKQGIAAFLQDTLHMDLALDKTLVTPLTAGFDFLGYHIRAIRGKRDGRRKVVMRPSPRSTRRYRTTVRQMCARYGQATDLRRLLGTLNGYLRGWSQYFAAGVSKWTFSMLDAWTDRFLARWLLKRHQGHRRSGWQRVLRPHPIPRQWTIRREDQNSRATSLGLWRNEQRTRAVVLARLADTPIRYSRLFGPYCPYVPAERAILRARRTRHAQPTGVLVLPWLRTG
ncbi:MAG: group II intron reverse transcriptase/maturase [Clostridia bacterium]